MTAARKGDNAHFLDRCCDNRTPRMRVSERRGNRFSEVSAYSRKFGHALRASRRLESGNARRERANGISPASPEDHAPRYKIFDRRQTAED
jgi:hypothetical protein